MLLNFIYRQPVLVRKFILLIIDIICIFISLNITLKTNSNLTINSYFLISFISIIVYIATGNYQNIAKYNNNLNILFLSLRNFIIISLIGIIDLFSGNNLLIGNISYFPFILINISLTFISRLLIKDILNTFNSFTTKDQKNAIIYGAGSAGALLANSIKGYKILFYVDDDVKINDRKINGILIKNPKDLQVLIKKFNIQTIILAIPSLGNKRKKEIFLSLNKYQVDILQVPKLSEINIETGNINKLKPIKINDILGRDVAKPNFQLMSKVIKNSVICVTGAGGSIGSEICKQIAMYKPKKLILIDQSEFNLFKIDEYLNSISKNQVEFCSYLGRAQHYRFIKKIFQEEKVEIVFHACAYKHVHLVEDNPLEGLSNNINSSNIICRCAYECNIKKTILISSDKAVRPTNIMGVSKRISELIFQSYDKKDKDNQSSKNRTIFTIVRFGNVLDSSGSVVPKFREQIASGGPLTLTNKRVIRYFMTLEEAAQLVIQSSSLGS